MISSGGAYTAFFDANVLTGFENSARGACTIVENFGGFGRGLFRDFLALSRILVFTMSLIDRSKQ